jgi:GT2 family glycosyltransferase
MASEAGRRAIEQHLERTGVKAQVLEIGPGRYRPKYEIAGDPDVAIIVPTGGSPTLEAALESLLTITTYRDYHVVVVDNSSGVGVSARVARFQHRGHAIAVVDCRGVPFNFSLLCNKGTEATDAHYFLFLNDDMSIITPDWIESMLEHAQRPLVGAVGSLLLFPNGTIQHAGVVTGLFEVAGHPFRGFPDKPYYFDFTHVIRNCSAVTGACLMTRRDVFEGVEGFDEPNLPTCFQDVDLCLKIVEKGLRVVYTPFAKLFHHESFSKRPAPKLPELKYMKDRWPFFVANDPYYNPNLTRCSDDYSLRYDHVFLQSDNKGTMNGMAVQTPSTRRLWRFGKVELYASRNAETGTATIFWSAAGAGTIQVRVGSPMGPIFAEGSSAGSALTGPWIEPGTLLYLLDATESSIGCPDKVLSILRIQ